MAFKFVILAAALAVANAGYLGSPSAITSTSDNVLRSHGNLAQVATQTKTIETPYSSSSKTDIRVSNPSVYTQAAYVSPAQYSHQPQYAAPAAQYSAYPAQYSAPAAQYSSHPAQYSAPAAQYSAPAAQYSSQYPAPAPHAYAQAAPLNYAPVAHANYAHAPAAAHQSLLGVAYSPANAVAHLTYSNVNDQINYGW